MAISNNSTGLRPGVCTSTTRPTAPYEGQHIYETDTDLTYIWGGSAWQQVSGGTAVGNSGLVYVTSASMSGSTFSISNCFTNTYDNYFIIINQMIVASGGSLGLQYKSGATVDSSANYTGQRLYVQSSSVGGTRATGQTSNGIGYTYSGYASQLELTIFQPYLTRQTFVATREIYNETNFPNIEQNQGIINTTTSYDGFVITPAGSTFSSGTVTIYGYRK